MYESNIPHVHELYKLGRGIENRVRITKRNTYDYLLRIADLSEL